MLRTLSGPPLPLPLLLLTPPLLLLLPLLLPGEVPRWQVMPGQGRQARAPCWTDIQTQQALYWIRIQIRTTDSRQPEGGQQRGTHSRYSCCYCCCCSGLRWCR